MVNTFTHACTGQCEEFGDFIAVQKVPRPCGIQTTYKSNMSDTREKKITNDANTLDFQ
jgi:hypothetical protein